MDAAGGAVGIVSLGIQVCQSLLSYYDGWKDYHKDISSTYNSIADLAHTFNILQNSLSTSSTDGRSESIVRVESCLSSCTEGLHRLQKRLSKLRNHSEPQGFRQKTWAEMQRVWYPFRASTLAKMKEDVGELRDNLSLALQTLQQVTLDQGLDSLTKEISRGLTIQQATDRAISDVLSAQQAVMHEGIIDWLSPPDTAYNHNAARKKREPNTGNWLLQSHEYQRWWASQNSLLWVTGKAGCGKTVLCSTVIEDIRMRLQRQSFADTQFAYFYFSFSDMQKQSYAAFLVSLVVQLAHDKAMINKMQQLYEKTRPSKPSPETLENLLLACLQQSNKTVLVLDALDELPESNINDDGRPAVLEWLQRVVHRNESRLRMFITSRQLIDIETSITSLGAHCVLLHPTLANNDIRKYVASELERHPKLRKLDNETKEEVKAVFDQRADGMFRWAFCQLETLKGLKSYRPKYVEMALYDLPHTLDATYERMLLQIDEIYHDEALAALRWLAFETRPLTLGELAEACLINYLDEQMVDVENRGQVDGILDILAGLIVVDNLEDDSEHDDSEYDDSEYDDSEYGDSEYGDSDENASDDGDSEHGDSDDNASDDGDSEHGGSDDNASDDGESDDGDSISGYSEDRLSQTNAAKDAQYSHKRTISAKSRIRLAHFSVKEYLRSSRILGTKAAKFALKEEDQQILAQSGLAYLLHYSQDASKTHSKADFVAFPFLRYAAETWPVLISKSNVTRPAHEVQLLHSEEHRMNWLAVHQPDIPGLRPFRGLAERSGTSLYYASYMGLIHATKELLRLGSHVNSCGGKYGNALQAASVSDSDDVVNILLEAGADVNAEGGSYNYALCAASRHPSSKTAKLLLDAGADINARAGIFGNALQLASVKGHNKVVKLLLDAGADINARAGFFGNALQFALVEGHDKMVKSLLDAGADINAKGDPYLNALQATSDHGHYEVVKALVEAGADTNERAGPSGNALELASAGGHDNVVKLLLDAGADTNAKGGPYMNALQAASAGGYDKVVKLLLDAGADINARAGIFGNALQLASWGGHDRVVKLLLNAGAKFTADENDRWSRRRLQRLSASTGEFISTVLQIKAIIRW